MILSEHEVLGGQAHRSAPDLVIYGHAGFDLSLILDRSTKAPGGAAYYAALAASLVNSSAGLVTVLGEDFPASSLQSLRIDTSGVLFKSGRSALFCQEYDTANEVHKLTVYLNACEELSPTLVPAHYLEARFFL